MCLCARLHSSASACIKPKLNIQENCSLLQVISCKQESPLYYAGEINLQCLLLRFCLNNLGERASRRYTDWKFKIPCFSSVYSKDFNLISWLQMKSNLTIVWESFWKTEFIFYIFPLKKRNKPCSKSFSRHWEKEGLLLQCQVWNSNGIKFRPKNCSFIDTFQAHDLIFISHNYIHKLIFQRL